MKQRDVKETKRRLSDILQSPSLDLGSALDLIEALMHRFHNYRDGSYFEGICKDVLNTAEQYNTETEPAPKQKTKPSSKLQGYVTMSQLAGRSESTKDTFYLFGKYILPCT